MPHPQRQINSRYIHPRLKGLDEDINLPEGTPPPNSHEVFELEICDSGTSPWGYPIGYILSYNPVCCNNGLICNGSMCTPSDINQTFISTTTPNYLGSNYGLKFKLLSFSSPVYASNVLINIISTSCVYCDQALWNSIPYGYTTQWLHWTNMSYNPPVVLPSQLIAQGYTSPSFGGASPPGFPGGYQMQNLSANLDYPNQSSLCEWCADWQQAGGVPGTFGGPVWGGTVPNPHFPSWGMTVAQAEALCNCCPTLPSGLFGPPTPPPAGTTYGGLSIPPTGTVVI